MRIGAGMDEQPTAEQRWLLAGVVGNLPKGMIDREHRPRLDMLVVHIGDNPNDAAWSGADVDELHYWVGPHDVTVDGILTGEHALRRALTDDHDRFTPALVVLIEVATFD